MKGSIVESLKGQAIVDDMVLMRTSQPNGPVSAFLVHSEKRSQKVGVTKIEGKEIVQP